MAQFTNFDRHENMNPETVELIMELIEQVREAGSDNREAKDQLRNYLFGLFDGYLYADVPRLAKEVFKGLDNRLALRAVLAVYAQCEQFPELGSDSPQSYQTIITDNNSSGNPRRLTVIYNTRGEAVRAIKHTYHVDGDQALREAGYNPGQLSRLMLIESDPESWENRRASFETAGQLIEHV